MAEAVLARPRSVASAQVAARRDDGKGVMRAQGNSLASRHALITGGGTGIGAAIARALAGEGAWVSLVGRGKEPLELVAKSLPKAAAITADITKQQDCQAMVAAAHKAAGQIDIVIANAGAADSAPVAKITAD